MRRRRFFKKLLGGGVLGAGAAVSVAADAAPRRTSLRWKDDVKVHGGSQGLDVLDFWTSRPVVADSLVVELNGMRVLGGDGRDSDYEHLKHPDGTQGARFFAKFIRRGDRVVMRYQHLCNSEEETHE